MIVTEFYKGQGFGNKLCCYIATRVIAKDKGYEFGIVNPELFVGSEFFDLDFGRKIASTKNPTSGYSETLPEGIQHYYLEKKIVHPVTGADIRLYDKNLVNVEDNTKIDGLMQDEQYIIHRKDEIKQWLKVKDEYECYDYADDNTCIINFRGGGRNGLGGFTMHKELFLHKKYWDDAAKNMLKINNNLRFIVITDDPYEARKFFPNFSIFHFSLAKDYVLLKNAKYLILSNSSFALFPAWLNENLKLCIAPKYWARYNVSDGYWSLGYNIISGWMYQDRDGNLNDYDTCKKEFGEYIEKHKSMFEGNNPEKIIIPGKKSTFSMLKGMTPDGIRNLIKKIIDYSKQTVSFLRLPIDKMQDRKRTKIWLEKIKNERR